MANKSSGCIKKGCPLVNHSENDLYQYHIIRCQSMSRHDYDTNTSGTWEDKLQIRLEKADRSETVYSNKAELEL